MKLERIKELVSAGVTVHWGNEGYEVIKDKVEFAITGMTCAACAARIEKGLQKLPGVYAAFPHALRSLPILPEHILRNICSFHCWRSD